MEEKYALCIEILKRLQKVNVLDDLILIGSWCIYFYRDYFSGVNFLPTIRTRDIDFLVSIPPRFKTQIDLPELFKDLGFIVEFTGEEGYMRLSHPELFMEFLVPEKGKGTNKPYPLPQIGMNAQRLRFLNLLVDNTITMKVSDMTCPQSLYHFLS